MNESLAKIFCICLTAGLAASDCAWGSWTLPWQARERRQLMETFIQSWPETSQLAARRLEERYGLPDEVAYNRLTWNGPLPWRRTIVHRQPVAAKPADVVEQAVYYEMPLERLGDLAAFNRGVRYDFVEGTLIAVSDSPELNRLAMNLADEVIFRRRNVEEARNFYEQILILRLSGKSSRYVERLLFPTGQPVWGGANLSREMGL